MKISIFAIIVLATLLLTVSLSKAQTPSCTDTDTGIDVPVKGTVTTEIGGFTDICNGDTLQEYYCDGTTKKSGEYPCASYNSRCSDGHCIPLTENPGQGYCNDAKVNDEDGKIDCADSDCSSSYFCAPECPVGSITSSCRCGSGPDTFTTGYCCDQGASIGRGRQSSPCSSAPTGTPAPTPTSTASACTTNQKITTGTCSCGGVSYPGIPSGFYCCNTAGGAYYSSNPCPLDPPCAANSALTSQPCICGQVVASSSSFPGQNCCVSGSSSYTTIQPCPASSTPSASVSSLPTPTVSGSLLPTPSTNATRTPTPSPIGSPLPSYVPPTKPAVSCNTDQDCAWVITNSCPENAGAQWACGSLLHLLPQYPSICPQILSPRPPFNCGCLEKNCVVYQDKKPTEIKKIGNTKVDPSTLLSAIIRMEQIRVKLDFLKNAVSKLSKYYNTAGNPTLTQKWSDISQQFQDAILILDSSTIDIKNRLSTFTKDDLNNVKRKIKDVIDIVESIIQNSLA